MSAAKPTKTGLDLMREPFPENQISALPKVTCRNCSNAPSRVCDQHRKQQCNTCQAWITTAHIDLSYVGHAALTERLLEADLRWTWEPLALGPDGLPALDRNGGMWIRLTVDGVTRLGYGDASGKNGGDAVKEVIGDALRNAGMRFGAALDLWHKGDLHAPDETPAADATPAAEPIQRVTDQDWINGYMERLAGCSTMGELRGLWGEAAEQWKIGKVTDEDMTMLSSLKDQQKVQIDTTAAAAADS